MKCPGQILLIFSLFSQADSKQLISKCTGRHKQLAQQCKSTQDVSKERSVSATTLSYLYNECKDGGIHTLFLDHLSATSTTPSYLSCSISKLSTLGSVQEVHTSLNTSLLVETADGEVKTTVQTQDGILMCKSSAASAEGAIETWWCGVQLKKSPKFIEIQPAIQLSEMTPALYGKKPISSYITETPAAEPLPKVKK